MKPFLLAVLTAVALPGAAQEQDFDYAQVEHVRATRAPDGTWTFDVTVRHNDQGWDHYADRWQVVDPSTESVLGERILLHPHDTEQPFTRSQAGIEIPAGLGQVMVRAACQKHGFGGTEITVDLNAAEGDGFEVVRNR